MSPTNSTKRSREGGYVMAMTALLLIPLMIFAALAVDVGGWYAKSSQIQRAADAASLAAVVYMPNEDKATAAALQVAAANGFPDQPGCDDLPCTATSYPQVVVTKVSRQQIKVDIFAEGDVYFGGVVVNDDPVIQRYSTSEFILPVPMGNPTSAIGMGSVTTAGLRQNYYLRADSECQLRQYGDFIGAGGTRRNIQSTPPGPGDCLQGDGTHENPNYREEGHTFIVDVPAMPGSGVTWELQARATCFDLNRSYPNHEAAGPIRLRLFDTDDTLLNDNDNILTTPLAETIVDSRLPMFPGASAANSACDEDGADWSVAIDPAPWVPSGTMDEIGRYVLQVKNPSGDGGHRATYSMRVVPSGTPSNVNAACTRVGAGADAGCPNIYAKDFMTVYSHNTMLDGGARVATLYLSEIARIHAGKRMEVTLFDPADGIDDLRIRNPQGDYVDVDWYVIDCLEYGYECPTPTGHGTPAAPISQTCGTGADPCVSQDGGTYSFQNRTIRINIDLPPNPNNMCAPAVGTQPENCWWTVEYNDTDGQLGEATTWGVRIIGDPVRLTE